MLHRLKLLLGTALAVALLALPLTAADAPPGETRFITNTRQLIIEGKRSGEGYYHPNGNLMVFQSEREEGNPFYQIYVLDLVSGESTHVSPGLGKTTCAFFHPAASRLLFASTHHDPEALAKQKAELEFRASGKQRRYAWDYDAAMDIFSSRSDGTELQRLTDAPGYDAEASFSPDGKQIVFCSLRAAYGRALTAEEKLRLERDAAYFGDIYIMNADGSNIRRLTTAPGYDGGPFFSPDGQRIVWRRFDEHGMNADVFTMKTDGSDVRRITDFKSMSWAPFYHPSGSYIVFTSNKLGFENFELFIADAHGEREPVRVSFTDGFDGLPVFSPDGKRLSWTSNRTSDGKSQIFVADWNHPAAVKALDESPKRARTAEETKLAEEAKNALQMRIADEERTRAPLPTAVPTVGSSELRPEIRAEDVRLAAGWLADEAREGRMTGTPGAQEAARWIADYLQKVGLQPLQGKFLQPFEFTAGVEIPKNDQPADDGPAAKKNFLRILTAPDPKVPADQPPKAEGLKLETDFRPLAFTDAGKAEGEVVFAGYGLSVPEDGKGGRRYNSYDGLDVKDKVVLLLRYVPEGVDPQRRAQLNRYAGIRYKAMLARERGAKAVLFVSGPNSAQPGELIPLTSDGSLAGSGILACSISGKAADALLTTSGKKLKDLQSALDTENPHAESGFVLPGVRVQLGLAVEHIKKTDENVVALLPPAATAGLNPPTTTEHHAAAEYIVVGAHYDHLGRGVSSNSMARSGEEGTVHHGADDNASGVAVILELAAALAQERREQPQSFRRGIIFALWSGEEMGLLGSSSFVEKPPVPIESIAAYVNFDMVGRLRENKLSLQGVGSSKAWRKLIERRNVAAGFSLVLQDDPYLPTDVTAFYPKKIPVLNFFTGAHEDYHRPTDTVDKLNYEGTERIAKFAKQLILDLASAPARPDFARVEKSASEGGSRETLRAYLGTIPDYTTEIKGVKISGVRGGSPAEKGGLKGGDVIVEFAGQKIANIYDYTYALDAVKIGQPLKVTVEREGKRIEVTVTPEARK